MIEIYHLKDKAELLDTAVQLFWKQWGTESNFKFYEDCMLHSIKKDSDLPRFYIAIQQGEIIGTYALLRNDLISRQDLFPWLACLYVQSNYRGQNIGEKLLQHARKETYKLGYNNLYLCTDLEGYYEKFGWTHLTSGYLFNGEETKIYVVNSGDYAN